MKHIPALVAIFFVVVFVYKNNPQIFFQQDEWSTLGRVMKHSNSGVFSYIKEIVQGNTNAGFVRFVPLTWISAFFVFGGFGLNTSWHGIFSLFLVFINASLIYWFVVHLTKSKLAGILVGSWWLLTPISVQAITWAGTVIPSQLSLTFFMLSLVLFSEFLDKKRKNLLLMSSLSIAASLLYKEGGAFYPVPILLLTWMHVGSLKAALKNNYKDLLIMILPFLIILVIPRFFSINILPPTSDSDVTSSYSPRKNSIYNVFLLPARSLLHIFLPQQQFYSFVYSADRIHYQGPPGAVESSVADAFSLMTSFWIVTVLFLSSTIFKKEDRIVLLFSLISFFCSTLPFVILRNHYAVLESRYFVIPAFWGGLIFITLVTGWLNVLTERIVLKNVVLILISSPLLSYYNTWIQKSISQDIGVGNYRREMLSELSELKPKLGNNSIFYFFTEHTGFYEFQSGFGQTLAVWLNDTGKIPPEALTDSNFWDSSYEGVKSFSTGKYGFFMTYAKLLDALKNNPDIELEQVHSYYWDYQKHTVNSVSEEIRDRLRRDVQKI